MTQILKDAIEQCRKEEQHDPVNKPLHYTSGKVECIDAIESAIEDLNGLEGYYTGNIIKYLWRWKAKNGVEDLEKAAWYLRELTAYAKSERQEDGTK